MERPSGAISAIPASISAAGRVRRWRDAADLRRWLSGWVISVAVLVAVTGAIEVLKSHVPVLSLGVLTAR